MRRPRRDMLAATLLLLALGGLAAWQGSRRILPREPVAATPDDSSAEWLGRLRHANPRERRDAIPVLAQLVEGGGRWGDDASVASDAANLLGEIGPDAAPRIPSLMRASMGPADTARTLTASDAIFRIGPAAIPILESAPPVPQIQAAVQAKLAQLRPALGNWRRWLTPENDGNRQSAVSEFSGQGAKSLQVVQEALADQNSFARRIGAEAIGLLSQDGSVSAAEAAALLVPLLDDRALAVRAVAIAQVGRLGPNAKAAIPALARLARDADEVLSVSAVDSLGRVGPDAAAELADLLRSGQRPAVRAAMLQSISRLGPAAGPAGGEVLRQLRTAAAKELPALLAVVARSGPGTKEAVEELCALHGRETDSAVRCGVLLALPAIGAPPARVVPLLLDGVASSDALTQLAAFQGLGRTAEACGDGEAKQAVEALGRLVADVKVDPATRELALSTLARFGQRARPAAGAIQTATKDADVRLAQKAAQLLRTLGGKS